MSKRPLPNPQRGEVWHVQLDDKPPAVGHEQAGARPILILSVDRFNKSKAELVIGLTLTSKRKGNPLHIEIHTPEGGVDSVSYIQCENIRTLSKERLTQLWGKVSADTLKKVEELLKPLLGFR
jgi:mRNA interferase MazF